MLRNSDVKVVKMDATRFSHVSSLFEVRGFPTIKFLDGEKVYTFHGERTEEDILAFVNKAKGPSVRWLFSIGKLNEAKDAHKNEVFYLFVGDNDPSNDLLNKYSSIAEDKVSQTYFYAANKRILPEDLSLKSDPTVIVFKDNKVFEFEAPRGIATMSSLQKWINSERYPAFPLISGGNINEMADTGKLLVIFVIDQNGPEQKEDNLRVKEMAAHLAHNERAAFHDDFQFLWMAEVDTVNNIMLAFVSPPYLMVLDPTVHLYYVPDTPLSKMDSNTLREFLNNVKSGKIEALGGTGFFQRLKRLFYDILVTVIEVWQSSRWLFLIMFGIPTGVISCVCYSLCCMETVDDGALSDEEEDSDEEYRQIIKEHKQLTEAEERAKTHPKGE